MKARRIVEGQLKPLKKRLTTAELDRREIRIAHREYVLEARRQLEDD